MTTVAEDRQIQDLVDQLNTALMTIEEAADIENDLKVDNVSLRNLYRDAQEEITALRITIDEVFKQRDELRAHLNQARGIFLEMIPGDNHPKVERVIEELLIVTTDAMTILDGDVK